MQTKELEEPLFEYNPLLPEGWIFIIILLLPLVFIWGYLNAFIAVISTLVELFFFFFYWLHELRFYSDHFELVFPFRTYLPATNKKVVIPYENIKEVRYVFWGQAPPTVEVVQKEYKNYKLTRKFYYAMILFPESVKPLLKIMRSAGVTIKLETTDEIKKKLLS